MATSEDHTLALAQLLGVAPGALPDQAVSTVAMIFEAKQRGIPWAAIAPAIGCGSGKEAKAKAKRLAKLANRALLTQAAQAFRAALWET